MTATRGDSKALLSCSWPCRPFRILASTASQCCSRLARLSQRQCSAVECMQAWLVMRSCMPPCAQLDAAGGAPRIPHDQLSFGLVEPAGAALACTQLCFSIAGPGGITSLCRTCHAYPPGPVCCRPPQRAWQGQMGNLHTHVREYCCGPLIATCKGLRLQPQRSGCSGEQRHAALTA